MIGALLILLAATTAPASPGAAAAGSPARLGTAAADSLAGAILAERKKTEDWLRADPASYLAAVERVDFGERARLTVGRAPDCDVRLDAAGIAEHHLEVRVEGDGFRVKGMDAGATFKTGGAEKREAVLGPSSIGVGRFLIRLSHQRFPALIVFDPQSPRFADYKGLRYFPPDLSYRYLLALHPNPRPDTVIILSTRGNRRRALRVGWFEFKVGTKGCRLEATRLLEPGVGEKDFSVFFRDATSGHESYEVGRYLDPQALPDGRYVLDFNLAYNPACAVSPHYNCPIPPKGNTLAVAIRAGEMDSHYH